MGDIGVKTSGIMAGGAHLYWIAIGSNRPGRAGGPRAMVAAAQARLGGRASRIRMTQPLGPGGRCYANAMTEVRSDLGPEAMLRELKTIEREFGRRRGRRWGDRVLDLDIIAWSGGVWPGGSQSGAARKQPPPLAIPHPAFRLRTFVLHPFAELAPRWRDPRDRLSARQLLARLDRARPTA